ncbi:MAG: WsbD [Candidatus Amesbacteria bacterium GW2011_GWB1_47_26]|uniref:WsbD n=1 Tax=Candidatus Amesbacteria bacterium GW2011_GWC2_45_19 TaxID=1618366 RepID=A0A0G1Q3L4_9BACT|nr:MAG: WsbD [Candidatus Amesbacteria bacterium GW2011_GWC2_45_19]KKU38587.1 MAG: WsbD [Candidatus Amesbacteria bacterium GW2011_GWA1_46_35]KKU69459.1 MAG: WsbD [Microgenomates group bacterium GW2011_GWC1_47_20]KKU74801.1 MAG: WsbD [Candidatus Amesbacteria bacterium GW2011_GWB1_47_26]
MKTLSIIILSYNVKKLLLDCLASIPKHLDWEVIVVDNASSDDSGTAVKHHFPFVAVAQNDKNLGFAAGNNVGIKKSVGQYILLLNPDTIVYPNTIETVLKYMQSHPKVGAATCRVELPDGSLDYSCHRHFPDPIGSFLHLIGLRHLSKYSSTHVPNAIHEIDALVGAFAMIRRTAGDQVSWLDEDYKFNGEDIDFCYKLKEKGWKVMYIPDVKTTHFKGSSVRAIPAGRRCWAVNSTDAMRLFYSKHLAAKYPFFVNWAVYLGIKVLEIFRTMGAYF